MRSQSDARRGLTRRRLLLGGAVAGLGAAATVGADALIRSGAERGGAPAGDADPAAAPALGTATVPFHGRH